VSWIIEFQEAYDSWDVGTDIAEDENIRLATLEFMLSWRDDGPPAEAEYDERREIWLCPIAGAPVVAEFVMLRHLDPSVVIVRAFRGP
jgi:hypothetical protein